MTDLHLHSLYSDDGEFTPAEMARMCAESGVTLMSVTDHNCARANREAEEAARTAGVRYVTGIEIDCVYEEAVFHVLGYRIDADSPVFLEIEENVARQGAAASEAMLQKTRTLGFPVTETEMRQMAKGRYWRDLWTGEMFAEALLGKEELAGHPLLMPYRPGGARSDNPYVNFYWDFYAQGKPCHAPVDYPAMEDVLRIVRHSGGIAVLAHPGMSLRGRESLLPGILKLGLDGIEAYSSYHTPEQAATFEAVAKERRLLATCGSDFHGKNKPAVRIGGAVFAPGTDKEAVGRAARRALLAQ